MPTLGADLDASAEEDAYLSDMNSVDAAVDAQIVADASQLLVDVAADATAKSAACDKAVCDDSNPCTADSCEPTNGCVATPTSNGSACGSGGKCADGGCSGQKGAIAISLGDGHSCVLTADGAVQCWGANGHGQLGNGGKTSSSQPFKAVALQGQAIAVSAGGWHTCAVTTAGAAFCWGANSFGQLGDEGDSDRSSPTEVAGLASGVASISAGYRHSCALLKDGGVRCWGYNGFGQLGHGSFDDSAVAVVVNGLGGKIVQVSAGYMHSCAVRVDGSVLCWGDSHVGALADAKQVDKSKALMVSGLAGKALQVAAGKDHTCALLTSGAVQCWGFNTVGQLGDGNHGIDSYAATPVTALANSCKGLSAGWGYTCAVLSTGALPCWGRNSSAQLGDGSFDDRALPNLVGSLGVSVQRVAAGASHTCAIKKNGDVKCWGNNIAGQIGDGSSGADRAVPGSAADLSSEISALAAGPAGTCLVTGGGAVQCLGANSNGEVGDGSLVNKNMAVPIFELNGGVIGISAGGSHSCAVVKPGFVNCWGSNSDGQLAGSSGNTVQQSPITVSGLGSGVKSVAAGAAHTCAVFNKGNVKCWGAGDHGQLGTGTNVGQSSPTVIAALGTTVIAAALGHWHSCALLKDGSVQCWGDNASGQLGDGTKEPKFSPVAVVGLAQAASAVVASGDHTCALLTSGAVQCWGDGLLGQLGDGGNLIQTKPVFVVGLAKDVAALATGSGHTCALYTSGGMACWGDNAHGQLGDGAFFNKNTAIPVLGLPAPVVAIASGGAHSCAALSKGGMVCWGSNAKGQLGDGAPWKVKPVFVLGFGGD